MIFKLLCLASDILKEFTKHITDLLPTSLNKQDTKTMANVSLDRRPRDKTSGNSQAQVGHTDPQPNSQQQNNDGSEQRDSRVSDEVATNTWNPFSNTDVTMHLTLDVQDDLDSALDNLSRLSRLGDFKGTTSLFHETLESHLDKPQVLIRWTEALLRQGDYRSVLDLNSGPIESLGTYSPNAEVAKLPMLYWRLMRLTAQYQSLEIGTGSKEWNVLHDVPEYAFKESMVGSAEVRSSIRPPPLQPTANNLNH